jgi:hypothetical protein
MRTLLVISSLSLIFATAGSSASAKDAAPLVDCAYKSPTKGDARCVRKDAPLGSGPAFKSKSPGLPFGYGFVEGNSLIVAVGNRFLGPSEPLEGTIMKVDLTTGDRTVVSGTWDDPASGPKTVGSGPRLGNVSDVQKGPDGAWYAFTSSRKPPAGTAQRTITKIDPKTGARTIAATLGSDDDCRFLSGGAPSYLGRLVLEKADTFYAGFTNSSGPAYGFMKIAVKDGKATCTVLSGSSTDPKYARGAGPRIGGLLAGLTLHKGSFWAVDTMGGALLKIDAATGDRVRVSSKNDKLGTGASPIRKSFLAVRGDTVSMFGQCAGSNCSYTVSAHTTVDLATGNRTGASGSGEGPPMLGDEALPVWAHPTLPYLIVANTDSLLIYDPANGNRNFVSYP